jgi:long-chain fatty acid transport protein
MVTRKIKIFLLLVGSMAVMGNAFAQGFALQNQNGAGTGYAYAGAAAVAEDASTIYFNPAGMTYLPSGHHVSVALTLLDRSLKFNNNGSDRLLSYPLGDNGGQAGGQVLVPAGYWTMSVTPELRVGLGVSPTYGSSTEWSDTFVGRYQGVSSEIKAINANPSIAWRANDVFSLGLGLNIVKFEADLRGMVPVTALLPATVDAKTKLFGSDTGYGYNLGAMLQLAPATRLGLTYRSKIGLQVKGYLETPSQNIPAEVVVELPDNASLAVSHMINERLQLLGDFTWTGWSSLPALIVKSQASGAVLSNENLGFKDSYRLGLGMQYRYGDTLRLRGGFAYDQSAVRNAADRIVRLPDSDRTWIALGFNHQLNKQTSVDVGYAHLFFDKAAIDRTNSNPLLTQVIRGSFDASVDILSVQLNHHY